jgi:hypothetical protein
LLAFLCGAWAFYFEVEGFFGWFSVSVGSVLLLYCNWFIRKARRIII